MFAQRLRPQKKRAQNQSHAIPRVNIQKRSRDLSERPANQRLLFYTTKVNHNRENRAKMLVNLYGRKTNLSRSGRRNGRKIRNNRQPTGTYGVRQ